MNLVDIVEYTLEFLPPDLQYSGINSIWQRVSTSQSERYLDSKYPCWRSTNTAILQLLMNKAGIDGDIIGLTLLTRAHQDKEQNVLLALHIARQNHVDQLGIKIVELLFLDPTDNMRKIDSEAPVLYYESLSSKFDISDVMEKLYKSLDERPLLHVGYISPQMREFYNKQQPGDWSLYRFESKGGIRQDLAITLLDKSSNLFIKRSHPNYRFLNPIAEHPFFSACELYDQTSITKAILNSCDHVINADIINHDIQYYKDNNMYVSLDSSPLEILYSKSFWSKEIWDLDIADDSISQYKRMAKIMALGLPMPISLCNS